MSEISRVALFGKLNSLGYKAIESATVFCKLRGNPYVELVHWFHQILQQQDSDLHRIVKHFQLDPARLASDLTEALDRLPRGATSISDLSSHVEEAVERGWVYGRLMFGDAQVRTGHLIVGMLKTPACATRCSAISREFDKIKVDTLTEEFDAIVGGSPETRAAPRRRRRAAARARRGQRRDGARGDGQAGGAGAVLGRPDRAGAQGRDRSDRRPRRGDPADRRHPDAPPAEQPDPHRRGRRRQDRGRRGLRAAHRRAATCRRR